MLDFPDNEDNPQDLLPTFQDNQLAPDSLVNLLLTPMCPREPHEPLAHNPNPVPIAPIPSHASQQLEWEHPTTSLNQNTTPSREPFEPLVNSMAPSLTGESSATPFRAHTRPEGEPHEPPETQHETQLEETQTAPLLFTPETEPTITK